MRLFRILCFLCLPVVFLYPIPTFSQTVSAYEESEKELFIPRDSKGLINPQGYFDIQNIFTHPEGYIEHCFQFIELLCQEEFIEQLSEEERNRVLDFAIGMVRFSIPKSRPDLKDQCERDIELLLEQIENTEEIFAFSACERFEYTAAPAVCYNKPDFLLCKSWFKRKWGHFSHWCGKHKKELIAGTAVVTIVGITIPTGGVGGSAATAIGGALMGATSDDAPTHINKPGEVVFVDEMPEIPTYPPTQTNELLPALVIEPQPFYPEEIYIMVAQETEIVKEISSEPLNVSEETFWDQVKEGTKEAAAHVAHEIFESATQAGEYYHQLNPSSGPDDLQAYRDSVEGIHQVIDQIFHTNQADGYSQVSKEAEAEFKKDAPLPEMQTGSPPPPGSLVGVVGRAVSATRAAGVVGAAAVGSSVTQPSNLNSGASEILFDQFIEAGKEK